MDGRDDRSAETAAVLGETHYILRLLPEVEFEYVSPSVVDLGGYTDTEHYADPHLPFSITHPDDRDRLMAAVTTESDTPVEVAVQYLCRDDRTIWVEHRLRRIHRDDGTVAVYGCARDVTDQEEDRLRLRRLDVRYRMLAEHASDVVFATDQDATLEWVSPSVRDVLGWSPESLIGRNVAEIVFPEHRARLVAAAVSGSDRRLPVEVQLRTADGGGRWMSITITTARDDGGQAVGRVGSARDIQAEHEAGQRHRDSERRLSAALDHAPIGMALVRPDGRFLRVNESLCGFLGREATSLMASHPAQLIHPDDLAENQRLMAELLRGHVDSFRVRNRYVRPDGSVVWGDLSVSCVRGPRGDVDYVVSQVVDVTDVVGTRDELRRSEERYRMLAENAADFVLQTTPEGVIEWVSPSITQVLGWQPESLVGRIPYEYLAPEFVAEMRRNSERLNSGETVVFRGQVKCADGSYRWLEQSARPVVDADGRIVARVSGWRDIQGEVGTDGPPLTGPGAAPAR